MATATERADKTVWIPAVEAAARARVSERTMQRWAAADKVKARKHPLTGRLLIDSADLERALAGETAAPVGG